MNLACLVNMSSHPWSTALSTWWVPENGSFIINWVDKGTKNHIEQEAELAKGFVKSGHLAIDLGVDKIKLEIKPAII